jgi:hypothetical protein
VQRAYGHNGAQRIRRGVGALIGSGGGQRRDEEVKVCQQRMRLLSTECKSLVNLANEAARTAEYGVDKVKIRANMAKLAERLVNLEDVLGKVRSDLCFRSQCVRLRLLPFAASAVLCSTALRSIAPC